MSIASGADTVFNPSGLLRLASGKLIRSNTFTSGFAGSGWQIDDGIITASKISAEFDNLTIGDHLSVFNFWVRQIRATNGSVFVSSTGKAKTVTFNSGVSYTIATDSSDNHGFLAELIGPTFHWGWRVPVRPSSYFCCQSLHVYGKLDCWRCAYGWHGICTSGQFLRRISAGQCLFDC